MTQKELDKLKKYPSLASRLLYKWFNIETTEYKRWWKYYCKCIDDLLRLNRI